MLQGGISNSAEPIYLVLSMEQRIPEPLITWPRTAQLELSALVRIAERLTFSGSNVDILVISVYRKVVDLVALAQTASAPTQTI